MSLIAAHFAKYSRDAANVDAIEAIRAQATDEDWTVERAELEMMRASRPQATVRVGSGHRGANGRELITAALMLHAGRPELVTKTYDARVAQQASDLRCHSLVDICAAALRADMQTVPGDRNEMIRAAFSTMSLPLALSTYAEKSAADAFMESPATWRVVAKRKPVNNFFQHQIVRVLLVGNLHQLPPGGQIKHATWSESDKTVRLETKALMLGIDRQDIINDNLGIFSDTAQALALAAARTMNDDFATVFMGNAGAFFASGNGNLASGVTVDTNDSRLNVEGLTRAISAMRRQTDAEGRSIDVRPVTLLVPPDLEFTARQLINSSEVMRVSTVDQAATGNPLKGTLNVEVEPRLSNTNFTGYSTTAWYLLASPQAGAINVALLNGRDTPVVESDDQPFNMLGKQYRSYVDYGFSLGEPAAAFKSTGAA